MQNERISALLLVYYFLPLQRRGRNLNEQNGYQKSVCYLIGCLYFLFFSAGCVCNHPGSDVTLTQFPEGPKQEQQVVAPAPDEGTVVEEGTTEVISGDEGVVSEKMYDEIMPAPTAKSLNVVKEFPWPPPTPSASANIPSKFLLNHDRSTATLKDVAKKLETAFSETGYSDISYHPVPDGFALISKLEHFNPDGTPKNPDRWSDRGSIGNISSYIKALFTANPGHYRVIAFIVTPKHFRPEGTASREQAKAWLDNGMSVLPSEISNQLYTADHYCKALIYEFEKPAQGKEPFFKNSSNLSGKDHLEKSNLWSKLAR